MPLEIVVKAKDPSAYAERKALAERVVATSAAPLPNSRLLCFFDDEDCLGVKDKAGRANRGFYATVRKGNPLWTDLPTEVTSYVLYGGRPVDSIPLTSPMPAFDHLVYLHGSTCSNEVGLTMTFAHELQHFLQHERALRLWAENTVAIHTLKHALNKANIESLGIRWCDIPIEREARIVARRTAEGLFRVDRVRQYIDTKADERVTEQDAADWKCIRDLDILVPYDLAAETKLFFQRLKGYRRQIERSIQYLGRDDPDFTDVDLDALLNATSE
jgi:hypothetical protein